MGIDFSNLLHWDEYMKLLIGLLAIMGWGSAIPVFLSLHPTGTQAEKRKMALIGVPTAAGVLVFFALFGTGILDFFGISVEAFRVAGGLIMLKAAFGMVTSEVKSSTEIDESRSWISLAVVPLALPAMAGPAAITTVIVYSQIHVGVEHLLLVALVILGAGLIVLGMLWFATWISRIMGPTGIIVFTRIFGLIVASIAIEFILDGFALHFPNIFQFEGHGE